jgi:hypothetical protein
MYSERRFPLVLILNAEAESTLRQELGILRIDKTPQHDRFIYCGMEPSTGERPALEVKSAYL